MIIAGNAWDRAINEKKLPKQEQISFNILSSIIDDDEKDKSIDEILCEYIDPITDEKNTEVEDQSYEFYMTKFDEQLKSAGYDYRGLSGSTQWVELCEKANKQLIDRNILKELKNTLLSAELSAFKEWLNQLDELKYNSLENKWVYITDGKVSSDVFDSEDDCLYDAIENSIYSIPVLAVICINRPLLQHKPLESDLFLMSQTSIMNYNSNNA